MRPSDVVQAVKAHLRCTRDAIALYQGESTQTADSIQTHVKKAHDESFTALIQTWACVVSTNEDAAKANYAHTWIHKLI